MLIDFFTVNSCFKKLSSISLIVILILSSTFLCTDFFVDDKITLKWYSFVFLSCTSGFFFLFYQQQEIVINKILIVLFIFLCYILIRGVISGLPIIDIPLFVSFLLLYIFFQSNLFLTKAINFLLIFISLGQAGYALSQYVFLIPTNDNFRILGGYGNPAGLAANLAFTFPLVFLFVKKYRLWCSIFSIVVVLTIILSESRAGLISTVIISGVFFFHQIPPRYIQYKKYILGSIVFFSALFCLYLFFLKENSARGRTLIWKITCNLIIDNPIFGGGSYSFFKDYMIYQGRYFARYPNSTYNLLAGNIMHSFNEYLLLVAKYGLTAFLILAYGSVLVVRNTRLTSPYLLCLCSIGIFSLFSYPFQYPITWIVLVYCLVQIANSSDSIFCIDIQKKWSRFIIMLLVSIACFFLIKDVTFEYKWKAIVERSLSGQDDTRTQYKKLLYNWNGNHLFLYNYAAELNHLSDYKKSLEILNKTKLYWNDYDIQMLYADNYRQLGNWYMSEIHLKIASNMCPDRFIPLYNLHEVYIKTFRSYEAIHIAKQIIAKVVKVPSPAVFSIKAQMKKYLKNLQSP